MATGKIIINFYDSTRQRIYIANSGMNRVEVFDIRQKKFIASIKVDKRSGLGHFHAPLRA